MKKVIYSMLLVFGLAFINNAVAQDGKAKVVKLTQVEGQFTKKKLTLKPGNYIFEVKNKSVERAVGLVVAPIGDDGKPAEHIQTGYLSKTVEKGESAQSGVVTLAPGTYTYFCPLNPTPEYTIVVK